MTQDSYCVHGSLPFEPNTGSITAPIYQSATFRHPSLGVSTGFDYTRAVNPTRSVLENTIATLEGAKYGLAFATGMGAISCLAKLFNSGDHVVVSEDLYGGTYRLFVGYYAKYGITFTFADTSDLAAVEAALKPNTKALFVETPSNPMMKISDIKACGELIHARGGALIVDNTFLTPYFQNPLRFGADYVVHSGSKYLSGHNDTLAGLIAHSNDETAKALQDAQMSEGASLSPFDAWLVLRGIKTLAIRMRKHQENGFAVAEFLRTHSRVERVFYAGFTPHAQSRGSNGMVSFYMKTADEAKLALERVKMILFAESLGGVESLITYPIVQTHSAIPEAMRVSAGINDRLLRLSAGIEDSADIIADLDQALQQGI
ncbi:MAG: PLP-dependent aspartate aminotransferase family protein [Helicobacteraceae bacterium]|jgi:cystathionine gamma-synthase|nr:PLP-dependent aspartate aminotransferase family protein [Helicobacteraceae bacterium]